MGIRDSQLQASSRTGDKCLTFPFIIASATSQTALKVRGATVPFPFLITRVEVFAKTVTAVLSVDVQIGTTTVLSAVITPVADTPTAGSLSTTRTSLTGASGDIVNVLYTTDGSGAFTGTDVKVWLRPQPATGEVYSA